MATLHGLNSTPATAEIAENPPEGVEAYERRLPEIQAVADEDLVTINVDVGQAVTTVLGCLPEILAYRDPIATLTHTNQKAIDGLRDYAMATSCANAIYNSAVAPQDDIPGMTQEATHLRDVLKADVTALTTRELIDPARTANLKGGPGYKSVAFELMDYAALLRDTWEAIQGKTALQKSEIDHAWKLAERMIVAIGHREQSPTIVVEATRIRAQAFTLFFNAYAEVRRAIQYLRFHEGDAETIAPSLYAGRGGQKTANAKNDPVLGAGTPASVATPAAANPAAVNPSAANPAKPAGAPVAPVAPVLPGMPGGSPFTS